MDKERLRPPVLFSAPEIARTAEAFDLGGKSGEEDSSGDCEDGQAWVPFG